MSKLTLDSVEWGEFRIKDVFEVANSKPYHKDKLMLCNNGIEYVTRTSQNNGVEDIVSLESNYILSEANSISLGAENADFFYHENKYLTGNKMYCIKNQYINKFNGLFLVNIFRNSIKGAGFGYGKGLTGTRFKTRYILLPIDDNGKPNWQFMEDYIKQEMKVQSGKVAAYYENKLMKLGFELLDYDVEWKEFKVKELFEVKPVKGKSITNYKKGKIPYITTSSIDNGLNSFIDTEDNISIKNCISIDPIGGKSFYHDYDFVGRGGAGSAINLLYNNNIDKYSGLFICRVLESSSFSKASYGVQLNGNRLKNLKLLLPIDKNGEPHWEYMSQFMEKLEKENIEKTLNHIYIYI